MVTVVFPTGGNHWQWQWSRWCFPRGRNQWMHRGVGNTMLQTWGGASRCGQYSVANVSVGIAVGAIQCCQRECGTCDRHTRGGKEAGGDNPCTGEEPNNGHT